MYSFDFKHETACDMRIRDWGLDGGSSDLAARPVEAGERVETAFAKINRALHVRERRADGYHALESLFVFTELGDRLTGRIRADGEIRLEMDGPFGPLLDGGPANLVIRAARALQDHLGDSPGADLRLTKILPVASGIAR